jgi:hypothetical protein
MDDEWGYHHGLETSIEWDIFAHFMWNIPSSPKQPTCENCESHEKMSGKELGHQDNLVNFLQNLH